MANPIDHVLDEFTAEDGWAIGVCACGWQTPPCPAFEEAANFWGQHLLAAIGWPKSGEAT